MTRWIVPKVDVLPWANSMNIGDLREHEPTGRTYIVALMDGRNMWMLVDQSKRGKVLVQCTREVA